MAETCTHCGKPNRYVRGSQWWSCRDYFGITGFFCSSCYDLISHNCYKEPNNPGAYAMMLLKYGVFQNG
jgi:hypothetical protein